LNSVHLASPNRERKLEQDPGNGSDPKGMIRIYSEPV
jgi:hypothetical protein